jgi:tetratricopeptide (TPR) repeat protein
LAASPRNPVAHFARDHLLRTTGRCEEAIPKYETALAFNRNWVNAIADIGRCKIYIGPIEEAIPLVEQAIRLSPRDPGIGFWCFWIGQVHLLQSRIDEAIAWLEKPRTANPELGYFHCWLASAFALKGETERAAVELADAWRLSGNGSPSSIAEARASAARYFVAPAPRIAGQPLPVTRPSASRPERLGRPGLSRPPADYISGERLQTLDALRNRLAAAIEDQLVHADRRESSNVAGNVFGLAGESSAGPVRR